MDVIATILDVARRNAVNAVLCAGDLFDDPTPAPGLLGGARQDVPRSNAALILRSSWSRAITIRLPPSRCGRQSHPFRARLPAWVHVVDRDDFSYELAPDVILYARPCRSKAGENDLAMALPAREPGDARVRIGCVHGCTFDMDGYQTNFPICRDAGVQRGLDYLAIGDTHSFRDVTATSPVPTVYPGAPEPTNFDEPGAGKRGTRRAVPTRVAAACEAEPVAFWRWIDRRCRDINELRTLLTTPDLERHVVRLHLDMTVSLAEESEVERILRDLQGTDATHGRAGVLLVDRTNLRLQPGSGGNLPRRSAAGGQGHHRAPRPHDRRSDDEAEKVAGDSRARAPIQAASEPGGPPGRAL